MPRSRQFTDQKPELFLVHANSMSNRTIRRRSVHMSGSDLDEAARIAVEQVIRNEMVATWLAFAKLTQTPGFRTSEPAICA